MNGYETQRKMDEENDRVYREEYGYSFDNVAFAQFVGHKRVCQACFAVMVDPVKHADWHDGLTGT